LLDMWQVRPSLHIRRRATLVWLAIHRAAHA
jgi:hypothetical protein